MSLTLGVTSKISQQIMAYENVNESLSPEPFADAIQIFGKLQSKLSKFAGTSGYATLLSRSLTLAKAKAKSLELIRIRSDGGLEFNEEHAANSMMLKEEGAVHILLNQFLGLLITFIGQGLTVNLLGDIWPDIPFEKS